MMITLIAIIIGLSGACLFLILKFNTKNKDLYSRFLPMKKELELHKIALKGLINLLDEKNKFLNELKKRSSKKPSLELNLETFKTIEHATRLHEGWDGFIREFEKMDGEWLNSLVQNQTLTSTDLKVLAMQKLHLSSREMASVMDVSANGVKKAKTRLRKKLNLEASQTLESYLLNQ